MRRVVVTGLGAITPLGVGVRRTWTKLIAGDSGIVSTKGLQPAARWDELTSTVAGLVPQGKGVEGQWHASDWMGASDQRRMSKFTQYAIAASDMALEDAGLQDASRELLEETGVCLGSGIGNLDEMYDTSLAHSQGVRSVLRTGSAAHADQFPRATKRFHHSSFPKSSSTWQPVTSP